MGEQKVSLVSDGSQMQRFVKNLLQDVEALEYMLENDWFETGPIHIGAEQEMCIIDEHYKPAPVAMELLEKLDNDLFTTELAKFNIEANIPPLELKGDCFSRLEEQLDQLVDGAREEARKLNSDIVLSGILPTIRKFDLDIENLTPLDRYHALVKAINKLRSANRSKLLKSYLGA